MAELARQYDIHLPLTNNEGQPIAKRNLDAVEQQLIERFGGLRALDVNSLEGHFCSYFIMISRWGTPTMAR